MAQILKFSSGGKNIKKYSNTLTINNIEYDVTDDLLNKFYDWGNYAEDEGVKYQYYKIADALKSGENLNLSGKSLSGNVDFDISEFGDKRMQKGVKWALGRESDARKAIDHALKFTYTLPQIPEPEKIKYDWSKKITASYDVKTEGKGKNAKTTKTWIDTLDNNEFLKRLDLWKSIATSTDDNIEVIGLDGITIQQLRDHYNTLGAENFDALYQRIKNGTANQNDHEILKAYNLFLFEDPKINPQKASQSVAEGYVGGQYQDPTLYKTENLFHIDPTTKQITFNDPNLLALLQKHPNIWINESFVSAYPQYSDLLKYYPKGVMIFQDGSIYDAQDISALSQHPIFQQFVLRNKETAGSSNEVIMQWWNPQKDEIFQQMGKNVDSLDIGLNNKYIKDLSWKYSTLPTIESAEGIIYTPSNLIEVYPETVTDEMFDYYGYILPQYLQKRAYASTKNGAMTYFDITNNAEYFSNLSNLPPISNVAQSNNKKNSTFMIPSINVDNNNFDILVDTPNYKVFRGENGSIRIAITQNGIWHWFKTTNSNIADEINFNYKNFDVDYFRNLLKNGYIKEVKVNDNIASKLIPKGATGFKIPQVINDWVTNNIDLNAITTGEFNGLETPFILTNADWLKKAQTEILQEEIANKVANRYNFKYDPITRTFPESPIAKKQGKNEDDGTTRYASNDSPILKFRPDDFWAITDLATSFIGNQKAIDRQKKALINAITYKSTPTLHRPIFSDNGLMQQKQSAINRINNTPIRYSDAALNSSEYLNKLSLIENIHSNTNAQLTDLYSKYKNQLLDIANKESALNTETDYENRKIYNTAMAAISQYDASKIAANGESIKKFIYEQREKTAKDLANLQQVALAEEQGKFEAAMKKEFENNYKWEDIKDEELRSMLMENANYMAALKYINPEYFNTKYHEFFKNIKLDPTYRQGILPYWMYGKSYTNYNKKGGKIRNVFQDAFLEDIKATNKALESLHKDIRKLLLNLTK